MASLEDLEHRIAALEQRLGMEAGLRASMDADLASINSKLEAQRHLLQALSITQADHTETLRQHTGTLRELKDGQREIIGLLNTLIQGNDSDST